MRLALSSLMGCYCIFTLFEPFQNNFQGNLDQILSLGRRTSSRDDGFFNNPEGTLLLLQ